VAHHQKHDLSDQILMANITEMAEGREDSNQLQIESQSFMLLEWVALVFGEEPKE